MSRRRSRHYAELRHRFFVLLGKLLVVAGILGLVAYYAYEVGFRVANGEAAALTENLRKAEGALKDEQARTESDRAALGEANRQIADLKQAYAQARPSDEVGDLLALVRAKLAGGMTARRLSLVIKSAETPHDCQGLPSRRLQMRSPRIKGGGTIAPLRYDEKVTVSAEEDGAGDVHQQWFDPASPVHIRLSSDGLRDIDLVGTLPIEYALSVQGSEYHFTLTAATAKGWIEVATERCSFR